MASPDNSLHLCCYILGHSPDEIINITAQPSTDVEELKQTIINSTSSLHSVSVDNVWLYKISIPVNELEKKMRLFQADIAKPMFDGTDLGYYFSERLKYDNIDVVIKAPVDLTIGCYILNEPRATAKFDITISSFKRVDHLKEEIKNLWPAIFQGILTYEIEMWHVNIPNDSSKSAA